MRKREFLRLAACGGLGAAGFNTAHAASPPPTQGWMSLHSLGISGDGSRLLTRNIQQAIDQCSQSGGGTLYFPPGTYLTGTLYLRNRVTLHLEAGATLLGSPDLAHYPLNIPAIRSYTDNYTERSLIHAESVEQIGFTGRGTIDGQGGAFEGAYKVRPYLLRLISCQDVLMSGITLKDSPMWVQHYLDCDGVNINGITVRSHCNANNDGIDIDGCRRVRISDCDISSGDDAIVLKSTLDRPCRNIVVTNCLLSSDCNAFKLGTESNGGFEDIAVSNCTFYDTRLSGIALETVDGGTLARVTVSNITMRNVRSPIFIRLGNRARPFKQGGTTPGIGTLRGVSLRDILATGADAVGNSITGIPGNPAEAISLDNVRISSAGGGKAAIAHHEVPEVEAKYPEYKMFGTLPAHGFYCRHVRDLRFNNVHVECERPDLRPAWVCDDVAGLELSGCSNSSKSTLNPVIRLKNVKRAFLHSCRSADPAECLLRVEGDRSDRIRLALNDPASATRLLDLASDTPREAVLTTL